MEEMPRENRSPTMWWTMAAPADEHSAKSFKLLPPDEYEKLPPEARRAYLLALRRDIAHRNVRLTSELSTAEGTDHKPRQA